MPVRETEVRRLNGHFVCDNYNYLYVCAYVTKYPKHPSIVTVDRTS